jgi:F0F1-type ATP synthase membrane subunit c/vacuolar-type H+-ATPase subunit K
MGITEAVYEVRPPEPPKHKTSIREMALIIAGIVLALAVGVAGVIHGNTMNASQNISTQGPGIVAWCPGLVA